MARILFASQPITGHVLPGLPIVRKLVERGHEVRWYTGKKFRQKVEATGATFEPYRTAYDYDDSDHDAAFPGRDAYEGLARIKYDFVHVFGKQVGPQCRDFEAILREFPADALVADPTMFAAEALAERGGPPFAVFSISCLAIKSRDTAPFGLGLLPSRNPLGRLRNRLLHRLASDVIFKGTSAELARQRVDLGLPPQKFEGGLRSPYLFLQPTVPGFEYPLSGLPPQVHFIGPLLPDAPDGFTPPPWWGEVENKRRPLVLVTQGTVANDVRELIAPTIRGLAGEDVSVIAAGVPSLAALGLDSLPPNARAEAFVPFKPLLPHVDVYVTNGGYGGVHYALANGVPIVAGGTTEDKAEVANRVAYAGVGVNLKTNRPTPEQARAAVRRVLDTPVYREKARRLQAELAEHDAPAEAAALIETLAATRQPVLAHRRPAHAEPALAV